MIAVTYATREPGTNFLHWAGSFLTSAEARILSEGAEEPTNRQAMANFMLRRVTGAFLEKSFSLLVKNSVELPHTEGVVAGVSGLRILTLALHTRRRWEYQVQFGLQPDKLSYAPALQDIIASGSAEPRSVIASTLHIGEVSAAELSIVPAELTSTFTQEFMASGLQTRHGFVRTDDQQRGTQAQWRPETAPANLEETTELIELLNAADFCAAAL